MTSFFSYPPFAFLSPERRRNYFWFFLVITILVMLGLNLTGAPMTTEAAPYGIVSVELAGSVSAAEKILESWDAVARERCAFNLGLDYLFMPVYATTISLGCAMASGALQRSNWPLGKFGASLGWLQFLAALLDAIENYALVAILFGGIASPWPQIAAWCAIPKFILIFMGIVYAIYGASVVLVTRLTSK
jgi:hypothetical protein